MASVTPDGVLFAKNSDRDPNEAQVIEWHEERDHEPGSTLRCTHIEIPQAEHTHAVAISRPWWMWGAEIGANSHGVVIGNEAVFTTQPYRGTGLLGMDLLRLALERAAHADAAVSVIVDLLEEHGQGGSCSVEHPSFTYHNSFIVADPSGAVVLETADRHWATEAVREGTARSISNGLTIPRFAHEHRDRLRGAVASCSSRRAITEAGAAGAAGPADLMSTLRDHGGSDRPRYSPANGAMRAPCMHAGGRLASSQTTSSWVADLRPEAHTSHWVTGTAAPCTSLFKPIDVLDPLPTGAPAINRFDPAVRWWRHEVLHRSAMTNPGGLLARFAPARDRVERAWLDSPPAPSEAWTRGDELENRWRDDIVNAGLPDTRPRWLRAMWERVDRAAEMPTTAQLSEGVPAHG